MPPPIESPKELGETRVMEGWKVNAVGDVSRETCQSGETSNGLVETITRVVTVPHWRTYYDGYDEAEGSEELLEALSDSLSAGPLYPPGALVTESRTILGSVADDRQRDLKRARNKKNRERKKKNHQAVLAKG